LFIQDICKTVEKVEKKDKQISYFSLLNTDFDVDREEAILMKIDNSLMNFSTKKKDFIFSKTLSNFNISINKRNFLDGEHRLTISKNPDDKYFNELNSPKKKPIDG